MSIWEQILDFFKNFTEVSWEQTENTEVQLYCLVNYGLRSFPILAVKLQRYLHFLQMVGNTASCTASQNF